MTKAPNSSTLDGQVEAIRGSGFNSRLGGFDTIHIGKAEYPAALVERAVNCHGELLDVLKAFVAQEVDYMTINNLGDPEKQHNVKWARTVISKAEGR